MYTSSQMLHCPGQYQKRVMDFNIQRWFLAHAHGIISTNISLYILNNTLLPKYESKLVRKSWQISESFDGRTDIVINRTFESLTFQHFFHEPTFHSVFYKLILCYFSVAIRVHSFPGQKCTVDMLWSRISLVGVMRFLNPVLLSKLTI